MYEYICLCEYICEYYTIYMLYVWEYILLYREYIVYMFNIFLYVQHICKPIHANYIYAYLRMHIWIKDMLKLMCIYICAYIYVYMCIYTHIYNIYMCVYVYTHIYAGNNN